jgi:transcriptional regulator with XRE-family HTH domain
MKGHIVDIGYWIKAARTRRGWTQHQLAGAARISRSTVSSAELGSHSTTLATLSSIAAALDVTLEHLFCHESTANRVADPGSPYGDNPCACLIDAYDLQPSEANALHRFLTNIKKRQVQ